MKSFIKITIGIFFFALLALSSCRNPDNEILETCFDEILNQGEERVDCGGPNCDPCLPSCDDFLQNQDEFSPVSVANSNAIGIDCGGANCPPCSTCEDNIQNAHWVRDMNLTEADMGQPDVGRGANGLFYRLVMEAGIDCGFPCPDVCPPNPDNGIQDGDEEGVDCGGTHPDAEPCPPPSCADGIQNGLETGIDCGDLDGFCPDCPDPTCDDGIQNIHIEVSDEFVQGYIVVVETGIDCDNHPLTSCPDCPLPTCFDGIQNGAETGIDCGGNCVTLCDPDPNCNNGIKDGNELGVDCGGPDCPPCPTCNDEIKNGIEFGVDCLDYDIVETLINQSALPYGYDLDCPICPSCHDGVHNEGDDDLFELDIDCGGPNCPSCEQFVRIASIGQGTGGSKFEDQYSYNKRLAKAGMTDTLSLDPNQFPGLKVTLETDFVGGGGTYMKVVANQGIAVDANNTLIRTITMYLPIPESAPEYALDTNIPMENTDIPEFPGPGPCMSPLGVEVPFIGYQVKFIQNNAADKCFTSFIDGTENSMLRYTYNFPSMYAMRSYAKGNINQGSLRTAEDILSGVSTTGKFTDLEFKLEYPYQL